MITVYLDHNIIVRYHEGEIAYLDPLLANKGVLPIISFASVDEIFRGGDEARSRRYIETLKRIGVQYIHSGPDESHMSISDLDYENLHPKWLKMQSDIGPLNDSHFLFINALFRGNIPGTIQEVDQAVDDQIAFINRNYDKFPNSQVQMDKILSDPHEYKELCRQLLHLKGLLPFTPKEINNIPEKSVFWTCVDRLKKASDANLQLICDSIEEEIKNAKTIENQFMIVFNWLNFFGYYPDDLTKQDKVRSNFSDANHATYAIACDAMLTLDKRFAKRTAAVFSALNLKTVVSTDTDELLRRIA